MTDFNVVLLRNEVITYYSENPKIPEYKSEGAMCFDIYTMSDIHIKPLSTTLVGTGLYFDLPKNTHIAIVMRSGFSTSKAVSLINGLGVIDSDYRGEIKLPLVLLDAEAGSLFIPAGERIAQGFFIESVQKTLKPASDRGKFSTTSRGEKGLGSTGTK